jgi:hypothetical protein
MCEAHHPPVTLARTSFRTHIDCASSLLLPWLLLTGDCDVCSVRPALLAVVRALQGVHYNRNNPFLTGNYAAVKDEVHVHRLDVIGSLPTELDGVYMRTGPNPQHEPIGGYAMCAVSSCVHLACFCALFVCARLMSSAVV